MVDYTFSLKDFEIFILVLVRISCFVYIAPFYGMANVPARVKVGLAVCIALLVNGFVDTSNMEYAGMLGYSVIVLKEGIYEDFKNREEIAGLSYFYSTNDNEKMVSLDDYISRCNSEQKSIYYNILCRK